MLKFSYSMTTVRTLFLYLYHTLTGNLGTSSFLQVFTAEPDLQCLRSVLPISFIRSCKHIPFLIIVFSFSFSTICLGASNSLDESSTKKQNHKNVFERFKFADGLIRRRYFDMAEKEFLKLLEENHSPELKPDILFKLGDCLRQAQKLNESVETLSQLKIKYPNHPYSQKAAIIIANTYMELGKMKEAKKELTLLIKRTGVDEKISETANYYLAVINNSTGNQQQSIIHFLTLADKPFSDSCIYRPYAVLNLAKIYKDLGKFNKSLEYLKRLDNSDSLPDSVKEEALFQLGELENVKGAKENAIFYYDKLLKNYPGSKFAQNALAGQAWILLNLKQYKKLIELSIEYNTLFSESNDELIYLRGLSLKQLDRFSSALTDFIEIVDNFDDSTYRLFSYYYAIDCLFEMGRYDELTVRANSFENEFPENDLTINVLFLQCQAFISGGKMEKALSLLHRISISYKDKLSENKESLLHLAKLFTSLGKFKQAALIYENLAKDASKSSRIKFLMNAADCEILGNDYGEAYALCESLLSLNLPKLIVPEILLKMTEINIRQNTEKDAILLLDRLIKNYPDDNRLGQAHYLRGTLHYYLENIDDAIFDLQYVVNHTQIEELEIAKLYLAYSLWIRQRKNESLSLFSELLRKNKIIEENLAVDLIKEVGYEFIKMNHYKDAEKCFLLLEYSTDYITNLQGALGIAEIEFAKGNYTKSKDLFYELKQRSKDESEIYGVCLSYLGETLLYLKKPDEALILFEEALNLDFSDSTARSRCRYGLASIYYNNKDMENALRYAMSVFVLFDNRTSVPKSMILSVKILHKLGRFKEMNEVLSDLNQRYPSHMNEYKFNNTYKEIFSSKSVEEKKSNTK